MGVGEGESMGFRHLNFDVSSLRTEKFYIYIRNHNCL